MHKSWIRKAFPGMRSALHGCMGLVEGLWDIRIEYKRNQKPLNRCCKPELKPLDPYNQP